MRIFVCRSDQISYLSALSISFSAFLPVWPQRRCFCYRLLAISLMFIRLALLRLVRNLSLDRSERRRLLKASVILLRHRRRSLSVMRIFLSRLPASVHNKLWLWRCLVCSDHAVCQLCTSQQISSELVKAISSTQAYADAASTLARDRNGYFQRGFEYRSLSRFFCERPPERLLVFHHYDRRGLPDSCDASWFSSLLDGKSWSPPRILNL